MVAHAGERLDLDKKITDKKMIGAGVFLSVIFLSITSL